MKAVVHSKYGLPELLKLKEIDKPEPKQTEILIKVQAATVNRTDFAILKGKPFIMRLMYGFLKPGKQVSGTDFAGTVEKTGDGVERFKVGDRVFGFDDNVISSHAEYMVIKESNAVLKIPENVSFDEAAAGIEGTHYAYNMINKVTIQEGQKALVNGASGAIGSAVIQLLRNLGVEVTAVCSTKSVDAIRAIGIEKVIDYTTQDFTKSNEKYPLIIDAVGKSSFAKCKPLLEKRGIYISSELGKMSQNVFYALFTPIFRKKRVVFPLPVNRLKSVQLVSTLLQQGKLTPIIDRKYTFNDITEAYNYVGSGQKTGSVLIDFQSAD